MIEYFLKNIGYPYLIMYFASILIFSLIWLCFLLIVRHVRKKRQKELDEAMHIDESEVVDVEFR